jgi:hypothetical protein
MASFTLSHPNGHCLFVDAGKRKTVVFNVLILVAFFLNFNVCLSPREFILLVVLTITNSVAEILHGFIEGTGPNCKHPEITNYKSFW